MSFTLLFLLWQINRAKQTNTKPHLNQNFDLRQLKTKTQSPRVCKPCMNATSKLNLSSICFTFSSFCSLVTHTKAIITLYKWRKHFQAAMLNISPFTVGVAPPIATAHTLRFSTFSDLIHQPPQSSLVTSVSSSLLEPSFSFSA